MAKHTGGGCEFLCLILLADTRDRMRRAEEENVVLRIRLGVVEGQASSLEGRVTELEPLEDRVTELEP